MAVLEENSIKETISNVDSFHLVQIMLSLHYKNMVFLRDGI
jgi:hypothetical protein